MSPFTSTDSLPRTAATHFKLWLLAAVLHIVEQLSRNLGSLDEVLEHFPFLSDYLDETAELGGSRSAEEWLTALHAWEADVDAHLPLRALRDAMALDDGATLLLLAIGMIEEDPRFAFLFESAQPTAQQQRPTLGLLAAWWRDADDRAGARGAVWFLIDNGVVQVINADAPRLQWTFQPPHAVWDALRGEMPAEPAPSLRFIPRTESSPLDDLVLSAGVRRAAAALPALLRSGEIRALVVRGPHHNGRRALARAVAAALGRGALELRGPLRPNDDRWPLLGVLATLGDALPVVVLDPGLGETVEIPPLRGFAGPLAVILGRHGSISGAAADGAVTITIDLPRAGQRRELWHRSLSAHEPQEAEAFARRFRMSSGNIRTAAVLARANGLLQDRRRVTTADVRVAARARHRDLETLATFIPADGTWDDIGTSADTLEELRNLESRCRHREELRAHVGAVFGRQLNDGVRALFSGPSGSGKTMAARILASSLQMDLYRLDLPAVVNKYIGESEKSLDQLFSRAEELDVVLLIDEGDALLTNRTAVQSSNDRYANLETNFLLQRLESFEGVLIVTTNAASRIDSAFQRRMDVIVEFRLPDVNERWTIWQLHLPREHAVDHDWLREAVIRCELSGGQIRNAVLHAAVLALDQGKMLGATHVDRALRREYRKQGAVCPLPRAAVKDEALEETSN